MPVLKPSVVVLFLFIYRRVANTSQGRRNGGYSISLAQFCAPPHEEFLKSGAGLSRSTVKESLRILITRGLIGRKPGAGTSADFYYLRPIPEELPDTPTTDRRRTAASGLKFNTVASRASGLNSTPPRVENQPASGLKFDTVLLKERTHERTSEKTQPKTPASVAVAVRPTSISIFDSSPLFAPWFDGEWAPTFGTHDRAEAEDAFREVVITPEKMTALIQCTRSYVASRDPESTAYAYHPQNFLRKNARNGFESTWKPFGRPMTKTERNRNNVNQLGKLLRGELRSSRP